MKKKYYKIGEKITLEVVEMDKDCKGCFFNNNGGGCDIMLACSHWNRSDKTNVIFKQIKTEC